MVYELKDVIDDIKTGYYSRNFVNQSKSQQIGMKINKKGDQLLPIRKGNPEVSNCIMMDDVPMIAPNGDVLATNISLLIKQGMSCLVVGPNGCGKSSLFRILSALWPTYGGKIQKPPANNVIYMPQRAYLPKGTLRDLIIYPDLKSKKTDQVYFLFFLNKNRN